MVIERGPLVTLSSIGATSVTDLPRHERPMQALLRRPSVEGVNPMERWHCKKTVGFIWRSIIRPKRCCHTSGIA